MMNRKPTPQLNNKELELLSAYLDGQLPEAQLRKVRQRLGEDAAFRAAYQDLKMTRLALRSAPQFKRRRSFTLTPEMVAKPAGRFSLAAASRLVAVVAAVLLVAVLAGDVFLVQRGVGMSAAMENYAAELSADDSLDVEMLSPEDAAGGGAAPEAMEQAVEEEMPAAEADMAEAAPEEPAVDTGADNSAADEDTGEAETEEGWTSSSALPTPTLSPEATSAAELAPPPPAEEPEEPKVGAGDEGAPTDGEIMRSVAPEEEEEQVYAVEEPEAETPWLLIVELGLLGVALISGVVAVITRRRM